MVGDLAQHGSLFAGSLTFAEGLLTEADGGRRSETSPNTGVCSPRVSRSPRVS